MVIVDQQGTSKSVVWAVLTNMTVQQASSQQLLFPLDLFFSRDGAYPRVETCSGEYRFCFWDTSEDHVVISGTP
jgi:DNA mismatch repair protein MutL